MNLHHRFQAVHEASVACLGQGGIPLSQTDSFHMYHSAVTGHISLSNTSFLFPATIQSAFAIFLGTAISPSLAFEIISVILMQVISSIPVFNCLSMIGCRSFSSVAKIGMLAAFAYASEHIYPLFLFGLVASIITLSRLR